MQGEALSFVRRHLVVASAFALVSSGAFAYGACRACTWTAFRAWSSSAEAAASAGRSQPATTCVLTYCYRDRTRTLTVPVSAEELAADREIRTDVIFGQPPEVEAAYLARLVRTQSRTPCVASIALQLRAVRRELALDSDEYVELMARAVQDIPYGTPRPDFKLPAEMLVARRGVCVDKSVLLAALLLREGYDAGVWSLPAKRHVAVALRGVGSGFRRSGYAFVETTRRAYVGEVPEEFEGRRRADAPPLLVKAGGWRRYSADWETAFIVGELREASARATALRPYRTYARRARGWRRERYAHATEQQMVSSAVASRLSWSSDDRRLAFAILETLNGWGRECDRL